MALYLTKLNNRGVVRIPDSDWAAMKLFGIVLPPLPIMCAGFAPIIIPPIEEVRTSVCVFLRGMAQVN
jgi:hypothetical protein